LEEYEDDMIAQLLQESEAAIMQDRELEAAYLKGMSLQPYPDAPNKYIQEVIEKYRQEALHAHGITGVDGTTTTPSPDEPTRAVEDAGPHRQEVNDGPKQTEQGT
jgi:hypothetical protein